MISQAPREPSVTKWTVPVRRDVPEASRSVRPADAVGHEKDAMQNRRLAFAAPVFSLALAACAFGPSLAVSEDSAPAAPSVGVPSSANVELRDGEAQADGSRASLELDAGRVQEVADAGKILDATKEVDAAVLVPSVDASDSASPVGTARAPAFGDVVLSEILFDPSGAEPDGEWIEVANVSAEPLELRGVTLRDGAGRTHTIGTSAIVAPGAFAVLVRSATACMAAGVPSSAVIYDYGRGVSAQSGVILANGSTGAILLERGGVTLARAAYGTFGLSSSPGHSFQVRALVVESNPTGASYCSSATPTPGAAPNCP